MATYTMGPYDCNQDNADINQGSSSTSKRTITFACSTTSSGYNTSKYNYTLNSIKFTMSDVKYYSTQGYFEVYNQNDALIGKTNTWGSAENAGDVSTSNARVVGCTFTLKSTSLANAMNATKFYIKLCRDGSKTGNLCNIRTECTGKVVVNYTTTLKNTAPTAPTLLYPVNGTTTYNTWPNFNVLVGSDAEQNTLSVSYRLDTPTSTGAWQTIANASASNGSNSYLSGAVNGPLSPGTYTLTIQNSDGTVATPSASSTFTVATPADAVAQNSTLITKAQYDTMAAQINNLLRYYGESTVSFSAVTAQTTKITASQVNALQTALKKSPCQNNVTLTAVTSGSPATAADWNALRSALLNW